MKLYFLEHAIDTEETGPYNPQIEKLYPDTDPNSNISIYRLYDNPGKFPLIDPKIDYVELKKGSKLSDVLSSSMFVRFGFIVSEKIKSIITGYELPEHKLYRVPVRYEGAIFVDYFWLHMLFEFNGKSFQDIQNENIIYPKSVFNVEKDFVKISQINIQSQADIKSQNEKLGSGMYISASSLVLNRKLIDEMPEIFKLPIINRVKWIIKQPLRDSLENNQCTGIRVTEIQNILFTE